ncbi:BAG family molecular chaperone regulator 4 [Platanthera zijinensis]|uniref:BAG family molecular chaperone regulator 4 n=1 Tax=Platanthera zijinensis TaxID=2320716 RepID=A0AAP0G425_9ASPA
MIKLTSRKLFKTSSKSGRCAAAAGGGATSRREIEWEMRPGGMLVQKREEQSAGSGDRQGMILVRIVVNGTRRHDLTVSSTTTFAAGAGADEVAGELKVLAGVETGLEPTEQRILFRGKEKEDGDHLHMAGVKEGDKVLLLEDPAIKERKLRGIGIAMQALGIEKPPAPPP